jgi:hypothetical protein
MHRRPGEHETQLPAAHVAIDHLERVDPDLRAARLMTSVLLLSGELARCEPKRLRYRLLHVAARLAFHARPATLRLQASWPWAADLAAAFERLKALPPPA